ncbi:dGTPase [Desulfovibrio sp. A2]|nr:dGTPase [Desulfovibrio sp. A2]
MTYPVVASMVKYPISSYRADVAKRGESRKYSYHSSEKNIFYDIFKALGLMKTRKHIKRHPLSYLVEAADDICYSIIDLEDAWEIRLVTYEEMFNACECILDEELISKMVGHTSDRRKVGHLRAVVIGRLVSKAKDAFVENYDAIVEGGVKDLISVCCKEASCCVKNAKDLAKRKVYSEHRKTVLEVGAYSVYSALLSVFIPAAYYYVLNDKPSMMYKYSKALEVLGDNLPAREPLESKSDELHRAYMGVIDYVSGMTDAYATFVAQQFSGAGTGPWQA